MNQPGVVQFTNNISCCVWPALLNCVINCSTDFLSDSRCVPRWRSMMPSWDFMPGGLKWQSVKILRNMAKLPSKFPSNNFKANHQKRPPCCAQLLPSFAASSIALRGAWPDWPFRSAWRCHEASHPHLSQHTLRDGTSSSQTIQRPNLKRARRRTLKCRLSASKVSAWARK